jgi:hypothetical protein
MPGPRLAQANGGAMSSRRYLRTRATAAALCVLALGCAAPLAHADSAFDGAPPSFVWGNFQYGLTELQTHGAAMDGIKSSSEYWRIEGGVRVNREWLVGVGTQDVPLSSSDGLSQLYVTALFNPGRGHWIYQAGVGSSSYTADDDSPFKAKYKGTGAQLGAGYDWTVGGIEDVHLGMRLNFEYSWLGDRNDGSGSLNHSRISFGFSASFY